VVLVKGRIMDPKERLEELRAELRAERISYGELAELRGLAEHIEPGDVELLEWAGVPEFPEEEEYPYSEFTLRIDLGNDAMREPEDIADALRRVAQMIENSHGAGGSIMDNNGNTVGKFETV
jgi:hypothetical protein